jgi:hypothetical protein
METNLTLLLLAFLPLLVAGILRGVTGFGLLLVATPLLFQLFPPKTVIAALVVPSLVTNMAIVWKEGISPKQLRPYGGLYASGAVGALVGVLGLVVLDSRAIFLVVAGYIVVFIVLQHRGDVARRVASTSGLSVVAGGSAGLLGGTIGLSGPPIVTYLHARRLDKNYFVGLLAVFFLTLDAVRIPSMYAADLFGAQELALGVTFAIPAALGTYLGAVVRPRVSRRLFEVGVEIFLALVALNLVSEAMSVRIS